MKKSISVLITAILLVMSFALAVCAENFVPSIGYKPAPRLINDFNGEIIVTSVAEAATTTKIPREVADDLIAKYEIVADENFKLSSWNEDLNKAVAETLGSQYNADSLVVRDFFNVYSYHEETNENIAVDGQSVTLDFEMDLGGKPAFILVHYDDAWHFSQVVDNGDGTATASLTLTAKAAEDVVSIAFEEFGHVAVLVPVDGYEETPQTGDTTDNTIWFFVMFAALAAIVALVVVNRKNFKLQKSN